MTADIKSSPRWQGLEPTGRMLDSGDMEPGKPIIITCHGHTAGGLGMICKDCLEDFSRVLADIPWLLDDLDIAIAGEAQFVEHGIRAGSLGETAGSSHHPAVAAQQRLTRAILGDGTAAHPGVRDWFDARDPGQAARHLRLYLARLAHEPLLPRLAHDISSAAARAHHVIDTPKDLVYYGPCPDCARDIVQERIHRDDTDTPVKCRYLTCGYAETLDLHQKRILDSAEDRWMTVTELVSAITSGGEVVTRTQIYNWERRAGLAREMRDRPKWIDGELINDQVWCFRLGDVRQRAAAAAQRKNPDQVA